MLSVVDLEELGFRVRFDERIFESFRYLAGADAARADELMRYFEDPDVRAIVPLRGGYGCARLVTLLDERRLRPHCKIFMGFSDLTTLHLYFRRRFGWVTLQGPMAISKSLLNMSPEKRLHLLSLLTDSGYLPRLSFPQLETWVPGVAEGKLAGGCLSIVVASLGTPYEIKTEGKILFLEDIEEPPYRVDRMLMQLKLAGKLDRIAGILLGSFVDCVTAGTDYTVNDTLREILSSIGVPVLAGFPAGHSADSWAIPFGVHVRLNADARLVEFLDPAVR